MQGHEDQNWTAPQKPVPGEWLLPTQGHAATPRLDSTRGQPWPLSQDIPEGPGYAPPFVDKPVTVLLMEPAQVTLETGTLDSHQYLLAPVAATGCSLSAWAWQPPRGSHARGGCRSCWCLLPVVTWEESQPPTQGFRPHFSNQE